MDGNKNSKAILGRLKQHYGFITNAQLANRLNVAPNTISGWIKRNSIDYDLIFSKCDDIDMNWLLLGKIPNHEQANEIDDDEFENFFSSSSNAHRFVEAHREYNAEELLLRYFHRKYKLSSYYSDSLQMSTMELCCALENYDFQNLFSKIYHEFKIDKDGKKFQDKFIELYKNCEGVHNILKPYEPIIREMLDKLTDYIGYGEFKDILDKLEQEDLVRLPEKNED